jgi:hypothetical protein
LGTEQEFLGNTPDLTPILFGDHLDPDTGLIDFDSFQQAVNERLAS